MRPITSDYLGLFPVLKTSRSDSVSERFCHAENLHDQRPGSKNGRAPRLPGKARLLNLAQIVKQGGNETDRQARGQRDPRRADAEAAQTALQQPL